MSAEAIAPQSAMRRIRLDPHLTVLLALTAILLAPLTAPGYFSFAHDARHTVYFFQMFDAALRDGAIYPRWATDMTFGYGYPVWIILAPLPYYLGELFHLIGLDFVSAAKAVDAVGLVGSGLAMYLFARRVLGKDGGLVAAVAYLFIPYHIVDLYVRAAGAEFLAFIFPPLVMLALYELICSGREIYAPLAAFAYAGLVLTHIQMALLFSPVIGAYIVMLWVLRFSRLSPRSSRGGDAGPRSFVMPIVAILLGLFLSATFLLPVAFEQRYLTTDPLIGGFFDFRQHFISISQLFSPFWGYGYAGVNGGDQFSLQIGILPCFLGLLAFSILRRRVSPNTAAHLILFALISIVVIVLMLPVSEPFWELAAPVIAFTQFPWRLLSLSALTVAFIAGVAVCAFSVEDSFLAALILSLLLALAMFPNARPQYTDAVFNYNAMIDFEVKDRELLGDTIWMAPGQRPQDSPLVAQYRAGSITQKAIVVEGEAKVDLIAHSSQWDEVAVNASEPVRVMFYTRYFPGWAAIVDGRTTQVEPYGEQGLISVLVPSGVHTVRTQFGDTFPRQAGAVVSVAALLIAIVWLWVSKNDQSGLRLQMPQAVLE